MGGNLLYGNFIDSTNNGFVRELTNYTIQTPNKMTSLVLGDNFTSSPDPLGGGAELGGISYSRDFGLNPYFVRSPTFNLSGQVLNPSIASLYVNGYLVRSFPVAPGLFSLQSLPLPQGIGNAQLILRDNFGNVQTLNLPFYYAAQTLKKGVQDFGYDWGYIRENLGARNFQYGPDVFLGHYENGLTNDLTAGMRVESAPHFYSIGPSVIIQLPIGVLNASLGWSDSSRKKGKAEYLNYNYTQNGLAFDLSYQRASPFYSNVSLPPFVDHILVQTTASLGFSSRFLGSVVIDYSSTRFRDTGRKSEIQITDSRSLAKDLSFFASFSETRHNGVNSPTLFMGLNYFLGGSYSAGVSYSKSGNAGTPSVTFQKNLPTGTGFGYTLQASSPAGGIQSTNIFNYQGSRFNVDVSNQISDGQFTNFYTVSGGIAGIGGKIFFTRPIEQGFALVEVPGVSGVRVYSSNQEIGRTDKSGDLLIPNLLPYFSNSITIENTDIPLNYTVPETKAILSVSSRGGGVIKFKAKKFQMATGSVAIMISGKKLVPAYGEMDVYAEGQTFTSLLGDGAEFYFENLPSGDHRAIIKYNGKEYEGIFRFPPNSSPQVDLGEEIFVVK